MLKKYFRAIIDLPLSVKWILVTELFYGFAMGIWEVNLNFHLGDNGISNIGIGNIAALGAIVTAISSIFIGEICTRIGYKKGMIFGCFIRALGIAIIAGYPKSLLGGQVLFSVGGAFLATTEFPLLMNLIEKKHMTLTYNLLFCTYQFSMFFGNLAGSFVSNSVRTTISGHSTYILICAILFAIMGMGRIFLPETHVKSNSSKLKVNIIKQPMIKWFLLYGLVWGIIENLILPLSLVNTIYKEVFKLSDSMIGIVFSFATLVSCITFFIAPLLLSWWKQEQFILVLFLINITCFLFLSFVNIKFFILIWLIISFIGSIFPGAIESNMLQAINEEDRGRYCGLGVTANCIGMGIGAKLSGFLLTYSNYSVLMIVGAVIAVIQFFIYSYGCKKYAFSQIENHLLNEIDLTFG